MNELLRIFQIKHLLFRAIICLSLLLVMVTTTNADADSTDTIANTSPVTKSNNNAYIITREHLDTVTNFMTECLIEADWRFKAGDDSTWASPEFDDSNWEVVTTKFLKADPDDNGSYIGWCRLSFAVDSSLVGVPLMFSIIQTGACEMYIDGELKYTLGQVGNTAPEEQPYISTLPLGAMITFNNTNNHLLTIRFSNWWIEDFYYSDRIMGIGLEISEAEERVPSVVWFGMWIRIIQMFSTGAMLVIAFIFMLLYLYHRSSKENLYFSILTIGCAFLTFWPFELTFTHNQVYYLVAEIMFKVGLLIASLFGLRLLYELFYEKLPPQFKYLVLISFATLLFCWIFSFTWDYAYILIIFIEFYRVLIVSHLRKRQGSYIIGLGAALFAIGCTLQIIKIWLNIELPLPLSFPYLAGILSLLISMSFYLAHRNAKTNIDLVNQLEQVEELSIKTIEQERIAKRQEVTRLLLEKDIKHQKKEIEEAKKLESALQELKQVNKHLRDTQSQLVQSEKMASLGMLVAGVAHEINTPVGAISSMQNTLIRAIAKLKETLDSNVEKDCELGISIQKHLDIIDKANNVIESGADRVSDIVKRLRSFARLDEAELITVNINEGIEDTLALVHHDLKYDIEVIREFGNIPEIACYAGQLNQVFLNIIVNARQAISGKGWIKIATFTRDNMMVIEISDSGDGIPEENLKKIFDPGFTTKGVKVGTGLGLSICFQIIELHQGQIKAKSELGKGTTFTISLPMNLDDLLENS